MTSSTERSRDPQVVGGAPAEAERLWVEHERLWAENDQLQQAVSSHAVVDQAIGAFVVLGQIGPEDGFEVLRDVSQRTNIKLHLVAGRVLDFARGGSPDEAFIRELRSTLSRRAGTTRRA
ncbi:ANTAR domain-containing protein [Streptomyces avermitilis]|uniref:ANTAR domain-containing protein n=1 Tax=Streptomyces avermitilis TaxID=33903 RepID=UPI0034040EC6